MKPDEFCRYLQGWIEIEQPKNIKPYQLSLINQKLQSVFNKVTPFVPSGDLTMPVFGNGRCGIYNAIEDLNKINIC